jgi:hypothetical protein
MARTIESNFRKFKLFSSSVEGPITMTHSSKSMPRRNDNRHVTNANVNMNRQQPTQQCFYCKKTGHWRKDCEAWLARQHTNQRPFTLTQTNYSRQSTNYGRVITPEQQNSPYVKGETAPTM